MTEEFSRPLGDARSQPSVTPECAVISPIQTSGQLRIVRRSARSRAVATCSNPVTCSRSRNSVVMDLSDLGVVDTY
jgi:hypothetical protein